jgi:hypothetical protein
MSLAQIEAIRIKRKRPQGFIVVTDLDVIARNARKRGLMPVLVDWDKPLDMRPLHGLDVLMVALDRDRQKTGEIGRAILDAEPRTFWAQYWRDDGEVSHCETEWIQR